MEEWQKPETFAIWLALVILVSMALVIAIIVIVRVYFKRLLIEQQRIADVKFEYQEKLISDSIKIQERERRRIAANLHDELISKLNIIKLNLYSVKGHLLTSVCDMLEDSITLGRNISHDLSPPLLDETSISELFSEFLLPINNTYQISFQLMSQIKIKLDKEPKLQLVRIFQEVINNIIKHADAKGIKIFLRQSEKLFFLKVEDDGKGFDPEKVKNGLGLKNIELRTRSLGASHKFKSANNAGSTFLFAYKHLSEITDE